MQSIQGQIVDVVNQEIFSGEVIIEDGKIISIERADTSERQFILPGFIDAHVHIESSMLVPSEFARLAVVHGTVATVSDPHEIANVMGEEGIDFMLKNASQVPFHIFFGAPSCVPATTFETAGAMIDAEAIDKLLLGKNIWYLSEMMNYPGVLSGDDEVMKKIASAKKYHKPVDGHAPGLKGEEALKYIAAGISTDHECFTYEEAKFKAQNGMKIIIREGSAAKNFDVLIPLIDEFPEQIMFCSDDKHPDDLVKGHINQLVSRALYAGYDFWKVLRAATLNPVSHYHLPVGLLQKDDPADFIVVDDLSEFKIKKVFIDGKTVVENSNCLIDKVPFQNINHFSCNKKSIADFVVTTESKSIRVIRALDGQLITESFIADPKAENGNAVSDIENDILKFTVVNRYQDAKPAVAFIHGFGLKRGAIASSVGHDSHNVLAVGVSDEMICKAVNTVIENKGGLAVVNEDKLHILKLPIAGLMSDEDGISVAHQYEKLNEMAKRLGTNLHAPFMTLSFMALLVIPELKLSDLGLFGGKEFHFVSLFRE